MTNRAMRATFGNKHITSTGLEHPELLRTPRGSNLVEVMETPRCSVRRTVIGGTEQSRADEMLYQLSLYIL
jgi:hypothetical protein